MEVQSHDAFLAFVFSGLGLLLSFSAFAATAVQTLFYPEYARLHSALVTVALASLVASSLGLGRYSSTSATVLGRMHRIKTLPATLSKAIAHMEKQLDVCNSNSSPCWNI